MHNTIPRRDFLKVCLSSGAALAGGASLIQPMAYAIEPIKRSGSARLLLSLAAYSFRDCFIDGGSNAKGAKEPARRIDLFQFIDFCADQNCTGAEVTGYYFPKEITTEFLLKLKHHAFLRGVEISGTAVGNTFTLAKGEKRDEEIASVKRWIDRAQILGAPHIRVFAGNETRGSSKEDSKRLCIAALEECCEYAGGKGIMLGLENHGGIVEESDEILEIVRAVKSPWLGINLDTGNFHTDDPYADLIKIAPYAVNVQIKAEIRAKGKSQEPADLPRMIKILRDANFQGYVALEYESSEDPWKAVPPLLKKLKELL
jgi:sugar phosphate isomerase/epimerase